MLIHLESGKCTAGWSIHHINTLAIEASHSKAFIIKKKVPWLRAGAPPRFVKEAYYDANEVAACGFVPPVIASLPSDLNLMHIYKTKHAVTAIPKSLSVRSVLIGLPR